MISKYCSVCLNIQLVPYGNSSSTRITSLRRVCIYFWIHFTQTRCSLHHFSTVHFQKAICVIFMHTVSNIQRLYNVTDFGTFVIELQLVLLCVCVRVCVFTVALDWNVLQQRGDDLQCSAQGTLQNTFGVRSPLLLWPSSLICHAGAHVSPYHCLPLLSLRTPFSVFFLPLFICLLF